MAKDSAANLQFLGEVYMRLLLLAKKVTDNFCDLKFEFRLGFNCISALTRLVPCIYPNSWLVQICQVPKDDDE